MSDSINLVAGIDLGTTYSCIAYVDEHGKPVVLRNFDNNNTTPSVVHFEDENSIIVGEQAKNILKISPETSVELIKRSMGDPSYLFEFQGKTYRPEEISSYILKKLVKDASDKLDKDITDVVITCPA